MESRTAVWLGCVGGMLVIGLLFAIGYKRLYERQANRVLNGGSLRWRLPEFRHVIIGGIIVIAFLSVVLFAAQRPSELACEGSGDGGQAVIDTEMDHMREQIEAYHEEQSGNIVIREQREDPYFDLVVLQNDQNDEYLMLIIGKADFPVNDDHYYRFSFVNNVQDGAFTMEVVVSGSELREGFYAWRRSSVANPRCHTITDAYQVRSYGEDPQGDYIDHTMQIDMKKEVRTS